MAAHTHQFTLSGGVRDIADGEVFAGKGILLTRLKTPKGTVAFYNTHVRDRGVHSCMLGYRMIALLLSSLIISAFFVQMI